MKRALEGLRGATKVEIDLARDLFRVTLSPKDSATDDEILEAVRALNYDPSRTDPARFRVEAAPIHPVGEAPDLVRKAIERARAEGKRFVIVDCTGER